MNRARAVALSWASSLLLALLFLGVGTAMDDLLVGEGPPVALLVALALLAGVAAWAVPTLGAREQAREERTLRSGVVGHVLALGVAERTRERAGRIVSTATDGVERAAAYRGTFVGPMIASMTVPLVVLLVVALTIDPVAALWLLAGVPAIPLAVGGFQAAFRSVSQRYRASSRLLSARFLDAFQGLTTLRLLGAGERMGATLADAAEDVRKHVMRMLAGNQVVLLVVDSVFSLAMITGAAALAMNRLADGAITAGQALALVLLSTLLLEPLDRIGQFFYIGMGGMASVREIRRLHAEQPDVVDAPGVVDPGPLTEAGVSFEGIGFAYTEGVPVLQDVTFEVAPGEKVALVGPSGSGKTTAGSLLQTALRPDSGRVSLGGHDLTEVPVAWVREHVAVVAQHTFLFTGTLRDNLLVAAPGASDADCWQALADADLAEVVRALPAGLDTPVGERGLSLSGGQAQRLAIARAFLKDAPVLVLDEPTSMVDLASERAILEALDRLGAGRTVLMISHRPATIAGADRVLTLTDGTIR